MITNRVGFVSNKIGDILWRSALLMFIYIMSKTDTCSCHFCVNKEKGVRRGKSLVSFFLVDNWTIVISSSVYS